VGNTYNLSIIGNTYNLNAEGSNLREKIMHIVRVLKVTPRI
jgi:hypothetical protein